MTAYVNAFRIFADYVTEALVAAGLPTDSRFTVEPPRDASHGDWTTNVAMVLGKPLGKAPRAVAEMIMPHLSTRNRVVAVEIAGPGFINVRMAPDFWHDQLGEILAAGDAFGNSDLGGGVGVNVEFCSANPTGPMHTAHARGTCLGDTLANLLKKVGYKVTREFYVNDAGNQIDVLARSTYLRYGEALGRDIGEIPKGLYPGEYLKDVGAKLAARDGSKWLDKPDTEWLETFKLFATDELLLAIKKDLGDLGVTMDVYTSEKTIRASGKVDEAYAYLKGQGLIYRGVMEKPKGKDMPDWEPTELDLFKATEFGDATDRPVRRADGSYSYLMPDVAYHLDKFQRSGPILITVVGADHSGWVRSILAAVAAVTERKAQFSVKVVAMVNTLDNGVPVRMSKRAGTFITLNDLVERVGGDVMRFVMLTRRPEEVIDFDFTKVTEQSKDNPVFYVQYAHARAHSALRKAADLMPNLTFENTQLTLLNDEAELAHIKLLAQFPRLVEAAAVAQEPHRIAYFVQELAASFHSLWNRGSDNATLRFVHEDNPELTKARLALVNATAQVVGSCLRLMGVQPREELR